MKIVLVNAPVRVASPHARLTPPLGLAYVAAALIQAGHDVRAIDFNISGLNMRRVDRFIEVENPAIVGISAHTETFPNALAIAKRVKELSPTTITVLGGPHPTLLPAEVLGERCVDFVVIGEGEATLTELATAVASGGDIDSVDGLAYKRGGEVVTTRPRQLLDPDAIPYPARDILPLELYADKWTVLTSRGACPFKCPFCAASSLWNGRRRARAPQAVAAEVKMLMETYGATHVFLSDDIFSLDPRWVRELIVHLKELPAPLSWGCSTRVDMVDDELLREMAEAGCHTVQFGVESGAQNILDSVKHIKKEQVLAAVGGAVANGMDVTASFMIPFPDDTEETVNETKELMRQLIAMGSRVVLCFTTPYPGTHFYRHAKELGLEILTDKWDEFDAKHNILRTKHLAAEDIDRLTVELVQDLGMLRAGEKPLDVAL